LAHVEVDGLISAGAEKSPLERRLLPQCDQLSVEVDVRHTSTVGRLHLQPVKYMRVNGSLLVDDRVGKYRYIFENIKILKISKIS